MLSLTPAELKIKVLLNFAMTHVGIINGRLINRTIYNFICVFKRAKIICYLMLDNSLAI